VGALIPFVGNGIPPARRALADLQDRIERLTAELERLRAGRRRLTDQMQLIDGAERELESLIAQDSRTLLDRIREGLDWGLAGFGGHRAVKIAESLAASQLQHSVGAKAAVELDSSIGRLQADIEDARAQKAAAVRSCLIESARGHYEDVANAITDLREALVIIAGLERVVAVSDGSYAPAARIVLELPAIGGRPAEAIIVPEVSIVTAARVWTKYASTIADNPMASADEMAFPRVDPDADDGKITYDRLTATERKAADNSRSYGVQ
jgi:hypothetical protein